MAGDQVVLDEEEEEEKKEDEEEQEDKETVDRWYMSAGVVGIRYIFH